MRRNPKRHHHIETIESLELGLDAAQRAFPNILDFVAVSGAEATLAPTLGIPHESPAKDCVAARKVGLGH
jgi:hypothetical protein